MSKETESSLFILPPLAIKRFGFYQRLLSGVVTFEQLGNRVLRQIKTAKAFRQAERVKELSSILVNIPIKEYRLIAEYHLALCGCREQRWDTKVFERVAEQSSVYKTRALMSLAAIEGYKANHEAELFYFNEALKTTSNVSDFIEISKAIAVIKAKEGFHKQALRDFENVLSILKYAEPFTYYDYLNSYAVELGEAGRAQEARNVSNLVLASPFIHAYPEWQETALELKEPNRSLVTIPFIEPAPVEAEVVESSHASEQEQSPSLIAFPKLKEAPEPQKPDKLSPQEWSGLNPNEKKELIMTAIRAGTFTMLDYDRLMVMVGLLEAGPADKVLDLEDEETLRDIAIVWAHQLEPEEMAAVLSTIRDCENDKRRNNIIDRMIRIAFEETQLCGLTEEAWRLQVERRLPKKK